MPVTNLLIIANPHARRVRRRPRLLGELTKVAGPGVRVETPHSLQALHALAAKFAGTQTPIAILGGDGTLSATMDALAHAWKGAPLPPILPLQGGTMNTIARSMTRPTPPARQLAATLRGLAGRGPLVALDRNLLLVDERRHGFLFGMGLIAQFLVLHYEAADPTPLTAGVTLGRVSAAALVDRSRYPAMFEGLNATVHIDGIKVHEGPTLAIGAGTCDDAGLRFRPFSMALSHPGHMHGYISTDHLPSIVRDLMRFRFALRAVGRGSVERPCDTMHIELASPAPFQLDGDLHPTTQAVTVRTGPSVRFVLPTVRHGLS